MDRLDIHVRMTIDGDNLLSGMIRRQFLKHRNCVFLSVKDEDMVAILSQRIIMANEMTTKQWFIYLEQAFCEYFGYMPALIYPNDKRIIKGIIKMLCYLPNKVKTEELSLMVKIIRFLNA